MASLPAITRACSAVIGLALLLGSGGLVLHESLIREPNGQLPASPFGWHTNVASRGPAGVAEEIAAIYDRIFQATVYYTPLETAFTKEDGFDMTPVTKPGLAGKKFPKDFLRAVELEGFGRMRDPVGDNLYVRCCRGRWGYDKSPLDSGGQRLKAMRSSAVGENFELIRSQARFRVRADGAPSPFLEALWEICDTGGGLKPGQIDFYWGEDAPMGPGLRLTRPRGMPHPIANPTVLVLR